MLSNDNGVESEGKRNGLNTILYCFDDKLLAVFPGKP